MPLWMHCTYECILDVCNYIFFNSKEVSSDGRINMLVVANDYTSDSQDNYACHWERITSDGQIARH
jgi:hypothetical protein